MSGREELGTVAECRVLRNLGGRGRLLAGIGWCRGHTVGEEQLLYNIKAGMATKGKKLHVVVW
jgi:hypothetical protein